MLGRHGNDTLDGGGGSDTLTGGHGDRDTCLSGETEQGCELP